MEKSKKSIRNIAYAAIIIAILAYAVQHKSKVKTKGPFRAPVNDFNFALAAGGDNTSFATIKKLAAGIDTLRPDLLLFIGPIAQKQMPEEQENSYENFTEAFSSVKSYVSADGVRVIPGPMDEKKRNAWKKHFGPNTYSSFEFHGCHFILVDSFLPEKEMAEQLKWLQNDLQKHARPDFTFVTMHLSLQETAPENLKNEVNEIFRLMAAKRVRLVFTAPQKAAKPTSLTPEGLVRVHIPSFQGGKTGNENFLWISVRPEASDKIKVAKVDVVGAQQVPASEFDLPETN